MIGPFYRVQFGSSVEACLGDLLLLITEAQNSDVQSINSVEPQTYEKIVNALAHEPEQERIAST